MTIANVDPERVCTLIGGRQRDALVWNVRNMFCLSRCGVRCGGVVRVTDGVFLSNGQKKYVIAMSAALRSPLFPFFPLCPSPLFVPSA